MRHRLGYKKIGGSSSHRKAFFRNMVTSLILKESCRTTLPKAKEVRRIVERFITKSKNDTLHNRRQAFSYFFDKSAVHKLFADIGPRFKERPGGYTRILKFDRRQGDAAQMAVIQLLKKDEELKSKPKAKARKKAAPKAAKAKAEESAAQADAPEASAEKHEDKKE